MIGAEVVADSLSPKGHRLTTMLVTMPRHILAELNTHRMLSKNSASSRAIPFKRMLEIVETNPFIPIAWQKDHSGMQGTEYLTGEHATHATAVWLEARDEAVKRAKALSNAGATKQMVNRLLEPFMWHKVLISGTEWDNFFHLRCPQYNIYSEQIPMSFKSRKDLIRYAKAVEADEFKCVYDNLTEVEWLQANSGMAEIHMMALAEAMWDAMNSSTPKELMEGQWHIPFGDDIDEAMLVCLYYEMNNIDPSDRVLIPSRWFAEQKVKIASARSARTSYTTVSGSKDKEYLEDVNLHDRLSGVGHWSPFEHCAKVMDGHEYMHSIRGMVESSRSSNDRDGYMLSIDNLDDICGWSGNFRGFVQYRKTFENENYLDGGK